MFLFAVFLLSHIPVDFLDFKQCQFLKMKFLSQQYQTHLCRYVCGRECTRVIEMIAQYITSHWTTWPLSLVDDRNPLSFDRHRGARILSACHAYLGRNRRDCDGSTGRRGIPLSFHFLGKLIASYRVSFTGIRTTHTRWCGLSLPRDSRTFDRESRWQLEDNLSTLFIMLRI